MMIAGGVVEFVEVEQLGKLVKMEHRFIATVFAEERYIFTEVHIF